MQGCNIFETCIKNDDHTVCECNLEDNEKDPNKCEPKPSKCNCNGDCNDNLCNGHGKCILFPGATEKSCLCNMSYAGEFCESPRICVSAERLNKKVGL